MNQLLQTERIFLRELDPSTDAGFILQLVNTPLWLVYIGDRGVKTLEDATKYILDGPVKSYRENGFGLWLIVRRQDNIPVGICGLIKREILEYVDIGFAMMPEFEGRGYAFEAARATLQFAREQLRLPKLVAITAPENRRSMQLLEKLGFEFEKMIAAPASKEMLKVFKMDFHYVLSE